MSLRRGGLAAALVALALGLGPAVSPADAGTVVLLQSRALGPYEAAAAGFRSGYTGPVLEISLDQSDSTTLAAHLLETHPDAIVTFGLRASLFVRDHMPRTPMVFCVVPGHERYALRTERSTGVSTDVPPAVELDALRQIAPEVTRVGLLHGPGTKAQLKSIRAAAAAAGLTLIEAAVSAPEHLPEAARDLASRSDAIWMPPDPAVAKPEAFRYLLELTIHQRKGLLVFSESLVHAGALVAVSPDYDWVGRRAADLVRRIQAGERPTDIPVARLQRTRIVVNGSTARAIGLSLQSLGHVELLP